MKNIRFRCWWWWLLYQMTGGTHNKYHAQNTQKPLGRNFLFHSKLFDEIFIFSDTFLLFSKFYLINNFFFSLTKHTKSLVRKGQGISRICSLDFFSFTYPFFSYKMKWKDNIKRSSNFSLIRNRRNFDFLLHFFSCFQVKYLNSYFFRERSNRQHSLLNCEKYTDCGCKVGIYLRIFISPTHRMYLLDTFVSKIQVLVNETAGKRVY